MITYIDNNSSTPAYEETKKDLQIDPEDEVGSRDRLDGIVARAGGNK